MSIEQGSATLVQLATRRTRAGSRVSPRLRDALLIVAFSIFIAVSAQISIPLPLVPLTGQDLAVLLTGAALGWRLGGLSVLAYLGEGMAGLPVFANGASAWIPSQVPGTPYILGTTGGYLVGFVAAAVVVGWLAERGWDRTPWRIAAAMALALVAEFACGLAWLARFVPPEALLASGLFPFLAGDALKLALAAAVLPGARALLSNAKGGSQR
jgi:biotin transport system substrate-specific component